MLNDPGTINSRQGHRFSSFDTDKVVVAAASIIGRDALSSDAGAKEGKVF